MSWASKPERGSQFLMRFMVRLTLRLGWRAGHALLYPITAYFLLASPASRAASRQFLTAALGRRPGWRDLFRHHFTFSATLLDRVFLLTGRLRGYDIKVSGLEHVRACADAKQGCILLGAHIGSFEVLRAVADQGCPVPVRALMYEANAALINRVLNALNPERAAAVIPIGTTQSLLQVKEALDQGELVGVLGDRITTGDKVVPVEFLGRPALLPMGPIMLASTLGAPVILFFGIHLGGRHYEVHFEPFADRLAIGRGTRTADLTAWAQLFAARLEGICRTHPYNWFNFYDFWGGQDDASMARVDQPAAGSGTGRPGLWPFPGAGGRPGRADVGAIQGPGGTQQLS